MMSFHKAILTYAFFIAGYCAHAAADTLFLYISKTGRDGSDGSNSKPFQTLEGSRNYIRTHKASLGNRPVVVYLRAGTYYIQNTFRLDETDILPGGAALEFKAYPKEYVSFNGGIVIGSRDLKPLTKSLADQRLQAGSRKQILKVDLNKFRLSDYGTVHSYGFRRPIVPAAIEVFVNKQPMTVARYPNDTGILLQKGKDMKQHIYTSDFHIKKWTGAKDAWVGGFFNWAWADDQLPVDSIDVGTNSIHVKEAPMFGFDTGADFRRWYAFNLLGELDAPGEYYIDRENGTLYFYPPKDIAAIQAEISVLQDPMISLMGMQNVSFQNITFENMRGMAVYIEQGKDNSIRNCTFRNIGMVAVVIGKGVAPFKNYVHNGTGTLTSETVGSLYEHLYENTATNREAGTNNGISNCLLYNIGNGAVSLGGGNRKTLEAPGYYVRDCNIHDFNRLGKTYKGAVTVDGVGNLLEGNHFYNAGQLAVYMIGNNHSIRTNEIDQVCREVDDMGAIYTGYNPSEAGNIISGNYFHHILPAKSRYRVAAVFLDDGTSNVVVDKNTFYKAGSADFGAINMNGGRFNRLTNNVFVDCEQAIKTFPWNEDRWRSALRSPLWQARLHQAVNIDSKVYAQQYPVLSRQVSGPTGQNFAERNVAVNTTVFAGNEVSVSNNWITNTDPGFVNLSKANFRWKSDAASFKRIAGFENPQVEKAGAGAATAGNPNDPFVSSLKR